MANNTPNKCTRHAKPEFDKLGNCKECVLEAKAAIEKFRSMKQRDRRA